MTQILLAKRRRGVPLCPSSPARGVRGLGRPERKDVLSTFFLPVDPRGSTSNTVQQPGFRRYWPVLLCYAAGLLAKQMAVTLPFLLLLLDYWPLGRLLPVDDAPAVLPQSEALSAE